MPSISTILEQTVCRGHHKDLSQHTVAVSEKFGILRILDSEQKLLLTQYFTNMHPYASCDTQLQQYI
jgi:hypothetical protein